MIIIIDRTGRHINKGEKKKLELAVIRVGRVAVLSSTVKIEGVSSQASFGKLQSVVSFVEAIDIINYFSVFDVPAELENIFQSVHNRKNQARIDNIKKNIEDGLDGAREVPNLSLTFVLSGIPKFKKQTSSLVEVEYDPLKTLVVDGVLVLFSIMQLLGFSHPFEKKRASKKLVEQNSQLRQELAKHSVQVTLLFNPEGKTGKTECVELYRLFSQREGNLYAPLNESINASHPINTYVREIADSIGIDHFGGMNTSSIRSLVSENYITNEATMIRLVLGALGGAEVQDKNKVEKFGGNVGPLSCEAILLYKPHICMFLSAWLDGVENELYVCPKGLYKSTQLWQALGLVLHDLINIEKATPLQCENAGSALGKINYSKSAAHWENCDVMEIDKTGKAYKNASGGGRAFRVGLARYLLSKLDIKKE